ncbi:hypothetical protein LSCM1_06481 [Leishmania martiniquensis]|uniref:AAA+ ATPase domain-containing protein n=1 Tax=Leishmania martiniquensis TaxID=1580590 RepID=A0A836GDM3_9TRYP|nr:hypothetical protein LSCM1_06481 [Leishmania martiniquensis]
MTGFTDALVLEAPVLWWPAVGDLPLYPIDDQRSFAAAIAEAEMPWPQAGNDGPTIGTVGLSRLGCSVMMTAEWSCRDNIDSERPPLVRVWNPLHGCAVCLPVSTEAGLGSNLSALGCDVKGSRSASLTALDLRQLTREGRVRVTHRSLHQVLSRYCCSRSALLTRMKRSAEQREEYALLHRAVKQAHSAALKHLERAAQAMDGVFASSSGSGQTGVASPSPSSLLFVGDAPSQRHLLRLLQATTPSAVQAASDRVFVLEVRRLDLAEVLTLLAIEALEVVEAVLRPPPLNASAATSSGTTRSSAKGAVHVSPCLLVIVESLHLLGANANALVASVTHELCLSLDALHAGPVPVLIWSFAEDLRDIPAALLTRMGAQHAQLSVTTAEDRTAYLARRLTRLPSVSSLPRAACRRAALSVAKSTAHWTVDRLVRLSDGDLANMLPSAPAPAGKADRDASCQTQRQGEEWGRAVGARGMPGGADAIAATAANARHLESPLHDVYSRLYGVEDAIRKVEELIVWPLTHLVLLGELAIPCAKGVLLCGPSGSGKTALLSCLVRRLQLPDARHIHVMSVDGLSFVEKEVGRTEKNIAQLFETARSFAPTALFIDNFDSLAPPRGRTTAETNTTGDRTLSTLLTQMDGIGGGQADRVVVVIASAPSIDTLDPAVYRPGRLDVHVQLAPPSASASAAFMKRRLREFVAHMQQLWRPDDAPSTENASATATMAVLEQVDQLVDEYLSNITASRETRADGAAAPLLRPSLSPAEVTAAIREVMLAVVARLNRHDSPPSDCTPPSPDELMTYESSDVVRAVRDAIRHLYAAA